MNDEMPKLIPYKGQGNHSVIDLEKLVQNREELLYLKQLKLQNQQTRTYEIEKLLIEACEILKSNCLLNIIRDSSMRIPFLNKPEIKSMLEVSQMNDKKLITEKEALGLTIALFKEMKLKFDDMKSILVELNADLEISEYTSIGSGSKMHKKIQKVLK